MAIRISTTATIVNNTIAADERLMLDCWEVNNNTGPIFDDLIELPEWCGAVIDPSNYHSGDLL